MEAPAIGLEPITCRLPILASQQFRSSPDIPPELGERRIMGPVLAAHDRPSPAHLWAMVGPVPVVRPSSATSSVSVTSSEFPPRSSPPADDLSRRATSSLRSSPRGVRDRRGPTADPLHGTSDLPVSGHSLSALPTASRYPISPARLASHRTSWLPTVPVTSHPKAWVSYGHWTRRLGRHTPLRPRALGLHGVE